MANELHASDLKHRVAFFRREQVNDGYGNVQGRWRKRFSMWAAYKHLRGGEAVMAGRLAGRHVQLVRVRASKMTEAITTDWSARDEQTGTHYNIRDITPSENGAWLDLLCESGVADG